tara:strand:- start:15477 stop:16280 length:804 start_codon:yes stop_codon:yes gene_type:complete
MNTKDFHTKQLTNTIFVIKIGGKVAEDEQQQCSILDGLARLKQPVILVHGGGTQATSMAEALGVKSQMVDGRRVTDTAMLDIAIMMYGGLINKKMVAQLESRGQKALGLTGADMGIIRSVKRPPHPIDFGWVGDIEWINTEELIVLLERGIIPVLAPLSSDGSGQLLNTNADSIAAHVAIALAENSSFQVNLNLCFDLEGVMIDGKLCEVFNPQDFMLAKKDGQVSGGMIPKLDLGFRAVKAGVRHVRIVHPKDLYTEHMGTYLRLD